MSTATVSAKRCVACNKDVTGKKRMKDSSGRYWCMDCGEADRLKKGQSGEPCGDCGERYPAAKLNKYGSKRICPACYKAATKGPGLRAGFSGGGGGGETDKKKLMVMLTVMGLLAAFAAYQFLASHH